MKADDWVCSICKTPAYPGANLEKTLHERFRYGHCLVCRTGTLHRQPTGVELKDTGMVVAQRAQLRANPEWRAMASERVQWYVGQGKRFTSNDITDYAGLPEHRNAVGALLSGFARRGIIRRVGFQNGERSSQHARVVGVWEAA